MRLKVKICGLRSVDDVAACTGADAMGVVVLTNSPRNLGLGAAREILDAVPRGVLRVAVTTCDNPAELERIVTALAPDAIQVHREFPPAVWGKFQTAVGDETQLYGLLGVCTGVAAEVTLMQARALRAAPLAAVVVDTVLPQAAGCHTSLGPSASGGTGTAHDWQLSRRVRETLRPVPVVLAGGLTPENVAQAMRVVAPDWVDVSSGVEEGERKAPHRVQAFLKKARHEAE